MIVDIVILSLTTNRTLYQTTLNALSTLEASEENITFNVVIVESNKNYDADEYPYPCEVIIPDDEFNYNRYCTYGIKHHKNKNEWIALCNNDLVFHKNWFSEILNASETYASDCQSFSTWNSYNRWHEGMFNNITSDKCYRGYGVTRELVGWCIVAKKEIFNKVKLDDRVSFHYSDNIYADELIKHNIKHALICSSRVSHITSQTLNTMDRQTYIQLTNEQGYIYHGG